MTVEEFKKELIKACDKLSKITSLSIQNAI
jgi:hypothetical protein